MKTQQSTDQKTADAFASSWNNLSSGSIYTFDQFEDWFDPLKPEDVRGKTVLELGCGNASLMVHLANWRPIHIKGVDLGDSVSSAVKNMSQAPFDNWQVVKDDLVGFRSNGYDVVYCIGVLHHLKDPKAGLDSVVRNTKSGGRFHVWVYAKEGNAIIRYMVDPLRKIVSKFPWWLTKYFVATPLVFLYFLYAKILSALPENRVLAKMPLYKYSQWIAKRNFKFFRHVAFDQLVTPQTAYIDKKTIENWLNSYSKIDKNSVYIIMRNGNSWKFGGKII